MTDTLRGAPDVSLAATPDMTTTGENAAGDLRNAQQILDAARTSLAGDSWRLSELAKDLEAVARLVGNAVKKLDGSGETPQL